MAFAGNPVTSRFRLGDWLVEPETCSLERDGTRVALEPRLMDVLVVLCERCDETLSAEQLLIECWRGTFYGDNPVHKSIAQLRRALGDSATEPRYIATIRKRGYRLVATVTFPDRYAGTISQASPRWADGAPYVGLVAFGASHRDVFFGRTRAQAAVLARLRERRAEDRGFLLVLGPSGCGKSSLLRAGVLPLLSQPGGFDGCQALACAAVDVLRAAADACAALADAMLSWRVSDALLFLPGERAWLVEQLASQPEALAALVGERLARRAPVGGAAERVVLLQLDQLEQIFIATASISPEPERLFRALQGLLVGGHVVAVAACRDDFYPRIVAVSALVALKADGGSFDLPLLNPGELAQIIRAPALAAGLRFEVDPATSSRLDDVLRDAAARQHQPLPLLQHALLEIYQRREGGTLSLAAYAAIGGLEGALAQRAEQTYAALPLSAQRCLSYVLRHMVVLTGDEALPVGRRVAWSELADVDARQLAQAFVEQRLFVAELAAGVPAVAAAHESLFRNWPRAREWVAENRRLLLARARLAAACRRWRDEGCRRDFLLPAGSQLDDARQLRGDAQEPLEPLAQAFVDTSVARWRRQQRWRLLAIGMVVALAVTASTAGVLAALARGEADQRRVQAEGLVGFMLGELTERLRALGKLDVLDSVGNEALRYLVALPQDDGNANTQLLRMRASRQIGEIRLARAEPSAAEAFGHAYELAERLTTREPDNAEAWLELGNAAFWLGQIPFQRDDDATAAVHWQRYHDAARKLIGLRAQDPQAQLELSYALNNMATLDFRAGRRERAQLRFAESASLKQRVLAATPTDESVAADLADTWTWIGRVDETDAALAAAEKHYREALTVLTQLRERQPEDSRWQHREALARMHVGRLALARGDSADAIALFQSAQRALERIAQADPTNVEWGQDSVLAALHLATAQQFEQPAQAQSNLRSALQQIESLRGRDGEPSNLTALQQLARLRLVRLRSDLAPTAVSDELAQIVEALQSLRQRAPTDALATSVLVQALLARAELARRGAPGDSAALAREAQQLMQGELRAGDVANLDARMRTFALLHTDVDAQAIAQRLASVGYRHPEYLHFLHEFVQPGEHND